MTDEEEIAWAIEKLSKCIKRRKAALAFMDAINKAKEMFLDPRAKEAGAEGGVFYSTAALTIRQGLINEAEVQEVLQLAWNQVSEACHAATGNACLTKADYTKMMRCAYARLCCRPDALMHCGASPLRRRHRRRSLICSPLLSPTSSHAPLATPRAGSCTSS